MLDTLERKVDLRDAQLAALENVILVPRPHPADSTPKAGRPTPGFISSYFGERQDPFTGHEAFHQAAWTSPGPPGSEVVSVADWRGDLGGCQRSGYGSLIEINHGNGYVTRYGHNQRVLVAMWPDGDPRSGRGPDGLYRPLDRPSRPLRSA